MSQIQKVAMEAMAQSSDAPLILNALTNILQVAIEHAVFSNRFEIDEQEPLSRVEALTEQLLQAGNDLARSGTCEAEELAIKTVIIPIICEASARVRTAIQ